MAAVRQKTRTENPFSVEAHKLRKVLAEKKDLTVEEAMKMADEIRVLEIKANVFTPEAAELDFTERAEAERRAVADGSELAEGQDELSPAEAMSRVRTDPRTGARFELGIEGQDKSQVKTEYVPTYARQYQKLVRSTLEEFGGAGNYLLALAHMGDAKRPEWAMSSRQKKLHEELQAFHVRTIVGAANDSSGGEFLLPLEQVPSIFQVPNVQPGILQIARRYPASGRTLRIPYVVQTNAAVTRPMAGIANVTIIDEAAQKSTREPAFKQLLLTIYKWAAYSEIGDETIMDDFTGMLPSTLQTLVGGQVLNAMNEYFTIDGTGSGQPSGAFYTSGAWLLKQPRKTASQINIEDIVGMYSQFTQTGSRASQRWFINRTALPQLLQLKLSGNTLVTFLGPSLRDEPVMQLFGIPVEVCDLLPVLGTEGDLALGNGEFYAYAVRQQLTVESSIHFKFDQDVTAYRFHARGGGIPLNDGTYAYKSPSGTKVAQHSPFVVLDDVIAS